MSNRDESLLGSLSRIIFLSWWRLVWEEVKFWLRQKYLKSMESIFNKRNITSSNY